MSSTLSLVAVAHVVVASVAAIAGGAKSKCLSETYYLIHDSI